MRYIEEIIIHCTDTMPFDSIDVSTIDKWHKELGYKEIGYHYLILVDGTIREGRDINRIGAHCKGHNSSSIGIAYVGGRDFTNEICDTRTSKQIISMRALVLSLCQNYPIIRIVGHCHYNKNKTCPNFDVETEFNPLTNNYISCLIKL